MLRKLLTPDIQRIKKTPVPSVRCSNKSSSDSGFFSVDLFLRKLFLTRLNGKNKVIVVLTVEIWHYGKDVRT